MLRDLQGLVDRKQAYGDLRKVAIIDVGSNSFRLIVITYVPGFHFQVTDEVRESVRLVQGVAKTGELQPAQISRALDVMRLYRSFCRALEIDDILAVATSAVREARNGAAFLAQIPAETGIAVRLLSGEEEAYYGYLAAENSTTLRDGFVIDLGGGSLEITHVEDRLKREAISLTLGALRMTEEFLPDAPSGKSQVERLRAHVRAQLEPLKWFKTTPRARLIGEGGSLRNAARLTQAARGYPLEELHGYDMRGTDLQKMIRTLEPLTVEQRRQIPGMKGDRADIALAGALVVDECMQFAHFDSMTVCSQGVREGLFYERFLKENPQPFFDDVRRASVMNIAHLYRYHESHCAHVARLVLGMYDQLRDAHLDAATRQVMWATCMLHDIGMSIDYNDHHHHGYYLILYSGLPGYTHRELALIALATRYHRKGTPDAGELAGVLNKDDHSRLLKMTALLRLAEQLDRARDGAVQDFRLHTGPTWARLEISSAIDISVALWSAQGQADIFEAAFGRQLTIVEA
jgi:exopolyphosphatase/guanosine-5'-triphosphate,3'-diphosphate pyrophosphatase